MATNKGTFMIKIKKTNITLMLLSVIFAAALVSATPSTQVWIPSTDIQGFMNPHLGWDTYINTKGIGNLSNGGITVGVLPFKTVGAEIGLDYRDFNGDHSNPLYVNGKIGIPEKAFGKYFPALAIGAYDFGTKAKVNNYNLLYGLIAKNVGPIGRVSVGGFKGGVGSDAKVLFAVASDPGKVDDKGILLSWDRTMTEISDKLWLGIDYQSGKSSYGAFSFGASWSFSSNVSVILGYDLYNDHKTYSPTATLQFDLNLK